MITRLNKWQTRGSNPIWLDQTAPTEAPGSRLLGKVLRLPASVSFLICQMEQQVARCPLRVFWALDLSCQGRYGAGSCSLYWELWARWCVELGDMVSWTLFLAPTLVFSCPSPTATRVPFTPCSPATITHQPGSSLSG